MLSGICQNVFGDEHRDFDQISGRMDLQKILLVSFTAFALSPRTTDGCETLPSNLHIIKGKISMKGPGLHFPVYYTKILSM